MSIDVSIAAEYRLLYMSATKPDKPWRSMTFGERVKATRLYRGDLSQTDVAVIGGFKQSSLSVIEDGTSTFNNVKARTYLGLMKALHVSSEFLLHGVGSPDDALPLPDRVFTYREELLVDLIQKLTPEQQGELLDPLRATVHANDLSKKNLKGSLKTIGNTRMEEEFGLPMKKVPPKKPPPKKRLPSPILDKKLTRKHPDIPE